MAPPQKLYQIAVAEKWQQQQHFHYCLYKYGHAIHVVFIDCMHFVPPQQQIVQQWTNATQDLRLDISPQISLSKHGNGPTSGCQRAFFKRDSVLHLHGPWTTKFLGIHFKKAFVVFAYISGGFNARCNISWILLQKTGKKGVIMMKCYFFMMTGKVRNLPQ